MVAAALAVPMTVALAGGVARGATQITVTTTADSGGVNGIGDCFTTDVSCTLRDAINATGDGSAPVTITIPAGTYLLSAGPPLTMMAAQVTLQGSPGAPTIIDADHNAQVMKLSAGSVTINDLTIQGGEGGDVDGAGLSVGNGTSAVLNDDVIAGNSTSGDGGGIATSGDLTLNDDVIEDNTADGASGEDSPYGGGLYINGKGGGAEAVTVKNTTISGNQAEEGGGILLDLPAGPGASSNTSLDVTHSAILSNHASYGGGGAQLGQGEDIGELEIDDTTVADNSAASLYGGGLEIDHTATLLNDTIAGNTAEDVTQLYVGDTTTIENTIITADGASGIQNCADEVSTLQSLGHNLDAQSGDSCSFRAAGDQVGIDPQLGPLQPNGGPTETMAPAVASPAIDAGTSSPQACPATDQRGVARPQGTACDIGAYESAPPVISSTSAAAISTTGATIDATVANPDPASATLSVEWGTQPGSYPNTSAAVADQTIPGLSSPTGYAFPLTALQPGTTFHYQVVAVSVRGTVTSGDQTFTTATTPSGATTPTVTTPPPPPPPPRPASTVLPSNTFTISRFKISAAGTLTAALSAPDAGGFKVKATFKVLTKDKVREHGRRVTRHRTTIRTYGGAAVGADQRNTRALRIGVSRAARPGAGQARPGEGHGSGDLHAGRRSGGDQASDDHRQAQPQGPLHLRPPSAARSPHLRLDRPIRTLILGIGCT